MRNICLAILVTLSFAFKTGDGDSLMSLPDACSIEAAQEAAQEAAHAAALASKAAEAKAIKQEAARVAKAAARVKAQAEAAEKEKAQRALDKLEAEQAAKLRKERLAESLDNSMRKASSAISSRNSRRSSSTNSAIVDSLVQLAVSLQGVSYRSGGNSVERGFDCSGFVSYVFKNFGMRVGRTSSDQALSGQEVSREDARAGDIVVFSRGRGRVFHAGLVTAAEDGKLVMVHSNQRGGVHELDILSDSYWKSKLHSIRRVL